ncbi:MAG: thioredoxin-like domain-containing protein [Isosphaeraceae bacterium]
MIHQRALARSARLLAGLAIASFLVLLLNWALGGSRTGLRWHPISMDRSLKFVSYTQEEGPSLEGGVGWINSGPIHLRELRGKIVLLDFWTFCCINCHHVLPDLAKLEAKYPNELVVIGVHTGKFPAEHETANIRRKVAEYRIKHPVINDARQVLWTRFGIESWPTLALIDANGQYVGKVSGEGHYEQLDRVIAKLVAAHQERGELNLTPLKFSPEMDRTPEGPLLFPGKVFADGPGRRLFVSDTGHNRIVQAGLDGSDAIAIGDGQEGFEDGAYDKARFNRPQGLYVEGDTLYVADTENHAIRAVDLKARQVATVAGTGRQMMRIYPRPFSGPARTTALSSPWDIIGIPGDRHLYIAMAGPHQIWKYDPQSETVGVLAGSGYENILDGGAEEARFAQPSGLATDGDHLFVADSEVSGIRMITGVRTREPIVRTIVGRGLFINGDHDGAGNSVLLQHCLGVAYGNGHLYIADSYNNKIKACTVKSHAVHTLVGAGQSHPGDQDNPPHFYEPGGISVAGNELYVADTNNHKVRVVDLKSRAVRTITLAGLSAPRQHPRPPSFARASVINAPAAEAAPGEEVAFTVNLNLAKGDKLNEDEPTIYLVEAPDKPDALSSKVRPEGERVKPVTPTFTVKVPLARTMPAGDTLDLRVSVQSFVCNGDSKLCRIQRHVWKIPVRFSADAKPGEAIPLDVSARGSRLGE